MVPETAGTILVTFWGDEGDEGDGIAEFTRYPVLAWIVDAETFHADPVICESLSDDPWCLEQRVANKQLWIFPEICQFESFDKARQYATEALKERRAIKRR